MDDEDRQLISSATKAGGTHADTESRGPFARLSVKLRDAIERSEASANALGDRIWWLNLWLLVFTIIGICMPGIARLRLWTQAASAPKATRCRPARFGLPRRHPPAPWKAHAQLHLCRV
jgi:hypothetical protein